MKVADQRKRFSLPRFAPSGLAQVKNISKAVISAWISPATISRLFRSRLRSRECWQQYRAGGNWEMNNGSLKRKSVLPAPIAGRSCTVIQRCVAIVKSRWSSIHNPQVLVQLPSKTCRGKILKIGVHLTIS